MTYLMGIDLGSTSLKSVIYDLEGNVVASSSCPTEKHTPADEPDSVYWKPEQIWGGTAAAIKEAVAQLSDPGLVKAVAVTGMGVDAVPLDEDGKWLYPFISWHDQRAMPQMQWWLDNIGAEKTYNAGGWAPWPINTALRMLWVEENEPEVHKRTHKWLLIEDFLNYMLCGKYATDYTMASCTLLFDQKTQNWSDEMLSLSRISRDVLSDPHPSGTPLGEVSKAASEATGLPEGTAVILGGHDHLCGALPVGAFKPGLLLDVTGTWEVVMSVVEKPVMTPELLAGGVTIQSHVAPGMYAGWGGAVASEMVEWFRKEYGGAITQKTDDADNPDWAEFIAAAETSPAGARGAMFLPHMSGSSSPVSDGASRGVFAGLTTKSTQGDMLRAIFEGLDYQFLDIVTMMEEAMDFSVDRIVAVGGAVRNKFWMQNKADVTGRPIDVPAIEEATPLGAAILAGLGAGMYKDAQDAFDHVNKPGETYEPDEKLTTQYAEWFKIYKELYPALKTVNQQLSESFGG